MSFIKKSECHYEFQELLLDSDLRASGEIVKDQIKVNILYTEGEQIHFPCKEEIHGNIRQIFEDWKLEQIKPKAEDCTVCGITASILGYVPSDLSVAEFTYNGRTETFVKDEKGEWILYDAC